MEYECPREASTTVYPSSKAYYSANSRDLALVTLRLRHSEHNPMPVREVEAMYARAVDLARKCNKGHSDLARAYAIARAAATTSEREADPQELPPAVSGDMDDDETHSIRLHVRRGKFSMLSTQRAMYRFLPVHVQVSHDAEDDGDVMMDGDPFDPPGTPVPDDDNASRNPTPVPGDGDALDARDDPPPDPDGDDDGAENVDDDPIMTIRYRTSDLLTIMIAMKVAHRYSETAFNSFMRILNLGRTEQRTKLPDTSHYFDKKMREVLPVFPTYVSYCDDCNVVIDESPSMLKEGICPMCDRNIAEDLKKCCCLFVKFPIREQIDAYVEGGTLTKLMEKYEVYYRRLLRGRPMYEEHFRDGNFTLSLFVDTAKLTRGYDDKFHPAIAFFNNIPVASQLRFPILVGMFCCQTKKHFPSRLLVQHFQDELWDLNRRPVSWRRQNDNLHLSRLFLTMCLTDAVEKKVFLSQVGHSGYYACPYCDVSGERITRLNHPNVWRQDMLCFMTGTENREGDALLGVRYPYVVDDAALNAVSLRSDEDRLADGRRALELNEIHLRTRGGRGWTGRVIDVCHHVRSCKSSHPISTPFLFPSIQCRDSSRRQMGKTCGVHQSTLGSLRLNEHYEGEVVVTGRMRGIAYRHPLQATR